MNKEDIKALKLKLGLVATMALSTLSGNAQSNQNQDNEGNKIENIKGNYGYNERKINITTTNRNNYPLVDGTEITVIEGKTNTGYEGTVMLRMRKNGKTTAFLSYDDILNYNNAHPDKPQSIETLNRMNRIDVSSILRINTVCKDEPGNSRTQEMLAEKLSKLQTAMTDIHGNTRDPKALNNQFVIGAITSQRTTVK